jgi:hypothetical protein
MRQVGDIVQFANITVDEFDRPILTPPSPKKIIRVNTSEQVPHRGWDYEIESRDGNHFFVYEYEIEDLYGG